MCDEEAQFSTEQYNVRASGTTCLFSFTHKQEYPVGVTLGLFDQHTTVDLK